MPRSTPDPERAPSADAGGAQRRYGDDILHGVRLPPDGRVLDLGCGTGEFTARLASLVPRGEVIGVDADRDTVAAARLRAEDRRLAFHVCPPQGVADLLAAESVDLVVSRAALHRVPPAEHPVLLSGVFQVLRPGGLFRAEFGGAGQLAAAHAIADRESVGAGGRPTPWWYPGPEDYRPLLLAAGFRLHPDGWVCLLHRRWAVRAESELLGLLRAQVLAGYDAGLPPAAVAEFRRRVEERALRELRTAEGRWQADFVRLDLSACRPKAESLI